MLRADQIAYRYGRDGARLFEDVSFGIEPGEIVGLQGASGIGKTTLAKILCGYIRPEKGRVLLDEAPMDPKGICPVQMVFQHPETAVNPRWKAGKILTEGFTPHAGLIRGFGIDDTWLARYPWELSGGQMARICLVRALMPETRFLVVDEMTAMLDAVTQAGIWRNLTAYAEENRIGILLISHDTHLVEKVCRRTLPLFDII